MKTCRFIAACVSAVLFAACSSQHFGPPLSLSSGTTQSVSATNPWQGMTTPPQSIGRYIGAAAPGMEVNFYISLPGRNQRGLESLIQAQNMPGSPRYHQYVTPQEFGREFGADPTQYAAAISQLSRAGFTIDELPANLKDIEAHAPASVVASFFKSSVDVRAIEGRTFYTLHGQPRVPAALRGAAIVGLDDYHQLKPHFVHGKPKIRGWGATDIENVYNLTPIYLSAKGEGITIADATEGLARRSDFSVFLKRFNLNARLVNFASGAKSPTDRSGETTLDVEWMAAVAPRVTIDQVTAANTSDAAFNKLYSYIVNRLSSVHLISTSWGDCEAQYGPSLRTDESLFEQAYSEGQFWLSAAGDTGVDDCGNGTRGVDFPGSSPYVVSVGGSRVTPQSTRGGSYTGWKNEVVWDDTNGCGSVRSCRKDGGGAGGGGASKVFTKPSFQVGLTPNDGKRDVPDVSFMADDEDDGGYSTYFRGSWMHGWGGTSFAAPQWTAFLALAEERNGSIASPLVRLYALGGGSSYGSEFHDIISGCNTYDGIQGFCAGPNYDRASGWGSFNGDSLWLTY
jgi:subtilase family serine protease